MLACLSALTWAATAQLACNASTFINGQPFPSLLDVDLEQLVAGLEGGLFTTVDLVQAYQERINEVNGTLHAVTQLNPDALSIAQELDAERKNGTLRSTLHGIPILIKNNIGTADVSIPTSHNWNLR